MVFQENKNDGFKKLTRSSFQTADIETLCNKLGYRFKSLETLSQSFRHASFVNEQPGTKLQDNQRLEFLGDAVLELAVTHLLMEKYPDAEEGRLSKLRAAIVDEAGLYRLAVELELGRFLQLGRGEEQSGGKEKPSILSDTLEALFGAIYLDGGFDNALKIARRLFGSIIRDGIGKYSGQDFKSRLQEFSQRVYKALPVYTLEEENGPAHDRTFRVALTLAGKVLSTGEGKNKKEAEQKAAEQAFHDLTGRADG
jgi:ribonuclease III